MGPHALGRDPAPSKVDGGKEHEAVQNEEAGDVGDGIRRRASACAVDESVSGDARSRREDKSTARGRKLQRPPANARLAIEGGDERHARALRRGLAERAERMRRRREVAMPRAMG
jgi:hypothetical protein